MLNPRMGHVSPQFHVKFDDFFKTVQDKPTDLDAPNPEWKYLSSFSVRKGPAKSGVKRALDGLLAPWRGLATATTMPLPQNDLQILTVAKENEANLLTPPQPAPLTALQLPQLQLEQPLPVAHQTRSSRVTQNTPRYNQSISQ